MLTDKQTSVRQFPYQGRSNKAFEFDTNCTGCIGQQLTEELKSFDADELSAGNCTVCPVDHEQIEAQLATFSLQATSSYITSRLPCCIGLLSVVNLQF